ncbi:MAG: HypC/HybG/HupF family hydrogenase formation chaperone [Gemmataceae bacterium]
MCLGVPGQIVELLPEVDGLAQGLVEFAGIRRSVCLACVPEAIVGDHVIVHAGLAISRLDAEEASRLLDHLRQMQALEEAPDALP